MATSSLRLGAQVRLETQDFQHLLNALNERGYKVVGPTLEDSHLILGQIGQVSELPIGWTAFQEAGIYRLKKRHDQMFFGYAVGQHSWKQFLFPPHQTLWQVERQENGFSLIPPTGEVTRYAFLGVRACDLAAIEVQDRTFLKGPYVDPVYRAHREQALIIVVNCANQEKCTCFCVSMGTAPPVNSGFDIALTEVLQGGEHFFVMESGTDRGADIIKAVPQRPAAAAEVDAAAQAVVAITGNMGREMDTTRIKELLYGNYEHPRWDNVAARCLTCGNCTEVCPTCFCHTIEDTMDLTGAAAERQRHLDVCFTVDFSYMHGGSIRTSPKSRYRQWLTHKLATWIDQFGCSGCVGCGRCITWCPVGIDITEEVRAIRTTANPAAKER